MKRTIAALAASSLFTSLASAQGIDPNADLFTSRVHEITARSVANCDPAVDVPALSTARSELLELREHRKKGDEAMKETLVLLSFAKIGELSLCWDDRLKGSGFESSQYLGLPRVIALNPDHAADAPRVLLRGLQTMKERFNNFGKGKMTEAELAAPLGLVAAGAVPDAGKLPREAPRKQLEYRLDATQLNR